MKYIFTPEDFAEVMSVSTEDKSWYKEYISKVANIKLNKLIESWPVVYGEFHHSLPRDFHADAPKPSSTHKAHLAFIEEILKAPCKHEPDTDANFVIQIGNVKCKHCGVELVAEWKEKK